MVRTNEEFLTMFGEVCRLGKTVGADAVVLLLEDHTDWEPIKAKAAETKVIVAIESAEALVAAIDAGLANQRRGV